MLFDARRAVDLLASQPDVDPDRLGAIGHSLGAKEALYLAAFDPRIRATVSSEGGIGLTYSNWDAPWYLGEAIRRPGFGLDHGQVLALAAPRAFLLIGGDSADGDASWPYIAAALPVWSLTGAPDAVGLFNHRQGHAFPAVAQERSLRVARLVPPSPAVVMRHAGVASARARSGDRDSRESRWTIEMGEATSTHATAPRGDGSGGLASSAAVGPRRRTRDCQDRRDGPRLRPGP